MNSLVIGAIDNLDWFEIKNWVYSLNQCSPHCRKVLIVYRISEPTIKKIQENKIEIFRARHMHTGDLIDFSTWKHNRVSKYRFYAIHQFLKAQKDDINLVILSDVRDVIFQSDPFRWLEKHAEGYDVVASSEELQYKNEPWSAKNIKSCYGADAFEALKDRPIDNAGLIAGKVEAMVDLSLKIYLKSYATPLWACRSSCF
jgi:hypothetical protein